MPRLLQSTMHPGSATQWLDDLGGDSRVATLSPAHPTLLVRLQSEDGKQLSRHELVFGLFRTVWHCQTTLDKVAGRLTAVGAYPHFETFEQTLCWTETEHGLSIQSDLSWTGARTGLEDLLLRSLLRFPGWYSTGTSERPTQRMTMEGAAAA
jgi:hypothetical protein